MLRNCALIGSVWSQVLLDNLEIKKWNLKFLRKQIGVVGQEPTLFATTIANNIRYSNETATMEEIIEAAKMANAHDFITKLPDVRLNQVIYIYIYI